MICMYCGRRGRWPDDFPNHLYAICIDCYPAWTSDHSAGPDLVLATEAPSDTPCPAFPDGEGRHPEHIDGGDA